jgi:asparagine synthase (glutamine-hydrolysing)
MLLAGRAIFGALSFGDDHLAALRVAEIAARAQALGAVARTWRAGPAILGLASRGAPPPVEPPTGSDPATVLAGEIFNAAELLLELTGRAVSPPPSGASVLEQILAAWGTRCLARIDGAYVAAAWDAREHRLLLACDRRGDAHLYHHADPTGIVFASWLPLIAHLAKTVDPSAVAEFLRFLYVAPPRTMHEGIGRLAPGTHLVVTDHGIRTVPHPAPLPSWRGVDLSSWSEADATDVLATLLSRAIGRRLGERRAGIFLSSGVDSATIAALHRRLYPARGIGITVAFADPALDESEATRAFAEEIGLEHRVMRFTPADYHRAVEDIAAGFDQPFADPAGLPIVLACRETAADVDVFSGGTGGDDLFGAPLPRHLRASLAVAARIPPRPRHGLARALGAWPLTAGRAPIFDFDDPEELLITWPGWTRQELQVLLGAPVRLDDTAFYRSFRAARSGGPQAIADALGAFPPDDCRFEGAGLVGRLNHFPYHDTELRDFVWHLPSGFRTRDGQTKVLLRALLARHAPRAAARTVKRYFNVPLGEILAHRDHALVQTWLDPDLVRGTGLLDPAVVVACRDRFLAGDGTLLFKVWALVVLYAWMNRHA